MRTLSALLLLTLLFLTPQFAQQTNSSPTAAPQPIGKEQTKEQAIGKDKKPAADDDQTIKLATELIEVHAVVTDKQGNPVDGLTKDDFEVIENNKPQEISFFNFVRIAGRGNEPATRQPQTAEEITGKAAAPPARSVLLFADTLHMGIGNLMQLKQSLRGFIDQKLTDQDLAALITSYGSLGIGEQFTRERRLLRYATERLSVGPSERVSAYTPYLAGQVERNDALALREAMRIVRNEEHIDEPHMLESATRARARELLNVASFRSRQTLLTLGAIVDRLAKMPGQRLLVVFSDGFTLLDNSGSPDTAELQNVISRAVRAGVIIYSVDSAGLRPPPMMSAEYGTLLDSTYANASESESQDGLNALAADTGGRFLRNTNDLVNAAGAALKDNEAVYTLAYYPNDESNPNRFRKLTVRVKGHADYKIRTQKGYTPAAFAKGKIEIAKTPDQKLQHKMVEPLAVTEIGVFARALDFEMKTDPYQASLQVFIEGKTLTLQPQADKQHFEAKITTMIFDSNGKLVSGTSETMQGNLLPARADWLKENGLWLNKRLSLKPGFYQIKVGVMEAGTERMGTTSAILQIPDLKRKQLTLSSVMLSDRPDLLSPVPTTTPTAKSSTQAPTDEKNGITAPQQGRARDVQGITFYKRNQSFVYYFQLYNNAPQTLNPAELSIQIEVWRDDKMITKGDATPLTERLIGQDDKGSMIGGQLILKGFVPGLYELRMTVRGQGKKTVATRMVLFGIED